MSSLGTDRKISSAAAYFQHAMVRCQFGLRDQPAVDAIEAGKAGHRVVPGRRAAVPGVSTPAPVGPSTSPGPTRTPLRYRCTGTGTPVRGTRATWAVTYTISRH